MVDGAWYIIIKGDYTGRVSGDVYDLTEPEAPELIELTPQWEKCRLPNATDATSGSASRVRAPKLRVRVLLLRVWLWAARSCVLVLSCSVSRRWLIPWRPGRGLRVC